jgi:hypothetical protein
VELAVALGRSQDGERVGVRVEVDLPLGAPAAAAADEGGTREPEGEEGHRKVQTTARRPRFQPGRAQAATRRARR